MFATSKCVRIRGHGCKVKCDELGSWHFLKRCKRPSPLTASNSRTWGCSVKMNSTIHIASLSASIQGLSGASSSLCRTKLSGTIWQHEELLKTWHLAQRWIWTLKNRTYKRTFKAQHICNLGPPLSVNMLSSEFFFFFTSNFQNYPRVQSSCFHLLGVFPC